MINIQNVDFILWNTEVHGQKKKTTWFHQDKKLSESCRFPQRKSKIKEGITYSLGTNKIKEKKKKKRRGKKWHELYLESGS